MKKNIILIAIVFSILIISGSVWSVQIPPSIYFTSPYVENELLIKFKESANVRNELDAKNKIEQIYSKTRVVEAEQLIKQTKDDSLGITRIYRIKFKEGSNIKDAISKLNRNSNIEYAEPNYLLELSFMPNDPYFSNQWYLHNTGQCINPPTCNIFGTPDADIDAPEAWDIAITENQIVVAVIDSGVLMTHEDLVGIFWENQIEMGGQSGVDDDGNGFIDDFYGWDFVENDNNPQDILNHGTPITGIISAQRNNSMGISGICNNCKIMNLKITNTVIFSMDNAIQGINYAINKNVDIISMSFAFTGHSISFDNVTSTANNQGILMVAGAGNNNWTLPMYPAAYEEVIGVAGTDWDDKRYFSSNYGEWIDISAPARQLYTTRNTGGYVSHQGTSFAAPVVAGVAGLILSKNPTLTKVQVEQILLSNCDNIDAQNPQYIGMLGCGRVNAYRALLGIPGTLVDVEAHDGYVSGQSDLTPGGRVIIGFKVTNNLDIPLYEVSVKLDTDSPDPDREFEIYILGPGETTNVNLHWSYQNAGTYNPFVIVDNNNIFTETNENNNRIDLNVVISEPLKPLQNEVSSLGIYNDQKK